MDWTAEEWNRLANMKAENERLEKKLAPYELFCEIVGEPAHEFASLRRELHRIERENVKLRELAHTIWLAGDFRAFLGADEIKERMRELGIEVD
jgi:hypothetical protein